MELDEGRIQHSLFNYLLGKGHRFVIPNVSWSWLNWEADLISITNHYYLYEYEIKISKADFMNDFKKRKHRDIKSVLNKRGPNYFSYVAPLKAMPLCIPDYAGLIEVKKAGRYNHYLDLEEIKRPKQLHQNKVPVNGIIAMLRTLMFKYINLTKTLEENKIQQQIHIPDLTET